MSMLSPLRKKGIGAASGDAWFQLSEVAYASYLTETGAGSKQRLGGHTGAPIRELRSKGNFMPTIHVTSSGQPHDICMKPPKLICVY
jgi:hypothetical protein